MNTRNSVRSTSKKPILIPTRKRKADTTVGELGPPISKNNKICEYPVFCRKKYKIPTKDINKKQTIQVGDEIAVLASKNGSKSIENSRSIQVTAQKKPNKMISAINELASLQNIDKKSVNQTTSSSKLIKSVKNLYNISTTLQRNQNNMNPAVKELPTTTLQNIVRKSAKQTTSTSKLVKENKTPENQIHLNNLDNLSKLTNIIYPIKQMKAEPKSSLFEIFEKILLNSSTHNQNTIEKLNHDPKIAKVHFQNNAEYLPQSLMKPQNLKTPQTNYNKQSLFQKILPINNSSYDENQIPPVIDLTSDNENENDLIENNRNFNNINKQMNNLCKVDRIINNNNENAVKNVIIKNTTPPLTCSSNAKDNQHPVENLELYDDDFELASSSSSLPNSVNEFIQNIIQSDQKVYKLTNKHLAILAKTLNIQEELLKTTIEQILDDSNCSLNSTSSGSDALIPCSQSPIRRRFLSQIK